MLAFTIVLGILGAIATIAQMTLLSGIVNAVFLSHKGLAQVLLPLALLMGMLLLRASLLWAREITAQRVAIRESSATAWVGRGSLASATRMTRTRLLREYRW